MKNKISRRLDSIKAAHESEKAISSRVEDYLEVISELVDMKGYAATLDISRYMNVSAPSVTKMLKKLDTDGYLIYEKYYGINLTVEGQRIADIIKQKHGILLEFFEILGIGKDIVNQDAEVPTTWFQGLNAWQIRKFVTFFKANPKVLNSFNDF